MEKNGSIDPPHRLKLNAHKRGVFDSAFSPDDKRFVTAGGDGDFVIWRIDGSEVSRIHADDYYVKTVTYSNDGKYILTGGGDNSAKLWSKDGALLRV